MNIILKNDRKMILAKSIESIKVLFPKLPSKKKDENTFSFKKEDNKNKLLQYLCFGNHYKIRFILSIFILISPTCAIAAEQLDSLNTNLTKRVSDSISAEILPEVVIKSNWIYRKDGNTMVDVTQMPNAKKLQTSQLLKLLPGVIRSNGTYTLNGKATTIYINGIKQAVSTNSMNTFLENLPANALSSIELIGVNTGRFTASTETIINIKTRSNIPLGSSLQPYVFTSFLPNGTRDLGGNLFYMTKFNRIITHHTLSYSNDRLRLLQTDSLLFNGKRIGCNQRNRSGHTNVFTYQGSMIYELTRKRKFHINLFMYNDFGNPHTSWKSNKKERNEQSNERSDLYNISFAYQFPSTHKKINGTISYALSYGGKHSKINYLNANSKLYCKGFLDLEGWMNTLSADFSSYIKDKWLLNYGIQIDRNSVWNNEDYRYKSSNFQENEIVFSGSELLPAFYAQARYKLNNALFVRGGLRVEHTNYHYSLHNVSANQKYTNVFPTFLLYYDIPNYALILGLTSNISRPKYEWMIPEEKKVNDNISFKGTPEIKPTKIYGLIARNTLFKYAQVNLTYAMIKDATGSKFETCKNKVIESIDNLTEKRAFRINLVLPFTFLKGKLTGEVQANVEHSRYCNFSDKFHIPQNRSVKYWNHSYVASLQHSPTNRLSLSLQAEFSPKQSSLLFEKKKTI